MAFLVIKNYWAVLYELSDKNMIHLLLNSLDIRRNSQKYSGEPVQNSKKKLYQKKYNFFEKSLAMPVNSMYTNPCCGMIAVKREVAGSQ